MRFLRFQLQHPVSIFTSPLFFPLLVSIIYLQTISFGFPETTNTYFRFSVDSSADTSAANCSTDYVWFRELPFGDKTGRKFCPEQNETVFTYRTLTRVVTASFLFRNESDINFAIEFKSVSK